MSGDEEPEGGRAAGIFLLVASAAGVGTAILAYSRDLLVILVWIIGAAALWRANKKMSRASNPAPPPEMRVATDAISQVTFVRDPSHPNRWVTLQQSDWLDWTNEDRDET